MATDLTCYLCGTQLSDVDGAYAHLQHNHPDVWAQDEALRMEAASGGCCGA